MCLLRAYKPWRRRRQGLSENLPKGAGRQGMLLLNPFCFIDIVNRDLTAVLVVRGEVLNFDDEILRVVTVTKTYKSVFQCITLRSEFS